HIADLLRRETGRFQPARPVQRIEWHRHNDQVFSASTGPARCSEPQISTRPLVDSSMKRASAAATEGAVAALIPSVPAQTAIASAWWGFCSPGMVTPANVAA